MTTINADVRPSIPAPAPPAEREPQSAAVAQPCARRWSREEYYRLGETGFFDGQKVELVGGEIFWMAPQSNLHAGTLYRVLKALERTFDETRFWIRPQNTIDLDENSSPDPDFAIVAGPRQS